MLGKITHKNEINNANFNLSINRLEKTTRDEMPHRLVKNSKTP